MASTYKVLGQNAPNATTLTTLYTVPASTSAVCSTLAICNRGGTATIRVAVRPAGVTISNQHFIMYDAVLNANDSIFLTIGLTLAATDVVSIYASTADTSFSLYGSEIV